MPSDLIDELLHVFVWQAFGDGLGEAGTDQTDCAPTRRATAVSCTD
jgi:hypothetical protein